MATVPGAVSPERPCPSKEKEAPAPLSRVSHCTRPGWGPWEPGRFLPEGDGGYCSGGLRNPMDQPTPRAWMDTQSLEKPKAGPGSGLTSAWASTVGSSLRRTGKTVPTHLLWP